MSSPVRGVARFGSESGVESGGTGATARVFDASCVPSLGTLIWFHGGGWVSGQASDDDWLCTRLAAMGVDVYSVDYRLAPKYPYPAALLDGVSILAMALAGAESHGSQEIVVGGASAGGNIAAGLTLLWRDMGLSELSGQLLICPAVHGMKSNEFDSGIKYRTGYGNDERARQEYWDAYVGGATCRNLLYAWPLMSDDFSRVPDALIVTAEEDPIRDEAEEYGRCLRAARHDVTIERFAGVRHGFFDEASLSSRNGQTVLRIIESWLLKRVSG